MLHPEKKSLLEEKRKGGHSTSLISISAFSGDNILFSKSMLRLNLPDSILLIVVLVTPHLSARSCWVRPWDDLISLILEPIFPLSFVFIIYPIIYFTELLLARFDQKLTRLS